MEDDILRNDYDSQQRMTLISGGNAKEDLKCPGPLAVAMGEVDKLRDYLQNGYRSSTEDIYIEEDSYNSRSFTNQEELITCLMVMKRLMEEAESESMRLKEEKRVLTQKIGESLNSVNKEMENLRRQLQEQDKRLSELGGNKISSKDNFSCNGDENYQQDFGVTAANFMGEKAKQIMDALHDKAMELEKENHLLNEEVYVLRNEISRMPCSHCADWKECVNELQLELKRAKDSVVVLKRERKKLKTEKLELLDQLKQLYGTLEDKEKELRDFIVNYEQRMKDSEEAITELVAEKERIQRERWDILRHASESTERSVTFKNQIDDLHEQLRSRDSEIQELREEIANLKSCSHQSNHVSETGVLGRSSSDAKLSLAGTLDTFGEGSVLEERSNASLVVEATSQTQARHQRGPSSIAGSVSGETQYLSISNSESSQLLQSVVRRPKTYHPNSASDDVFNNDGTKNGDVVVPRRYPSRRRTLSNALSKVFQKGGVGDLGAMPAPVARQDGWRTGVDESTIDKWEVWDQMQKEPMSKWKADAVLVWLEVECCMGIYSQKCYENIKSGKLLLELSDNELATALSITNPIHKLKLKLAIDDHKHPERRDSRLSKLDHVWVSYTWLRDLGLGQYSAAFENNLVDGRLLTVLGKKDLEKHFGLAKKSHQASFTHGLELLRMLNFDKDGLHIRRSNCRDTNIDLIVWTNERVMKWVSSIDLKEYADNLQDSGIHGAHMVLDSSFGTDTMATALHIPNDKNVVLKHLQSELTTLLNTARNSPSLASHVKWGKSRKPIGRSFSLKWSRKGHSENSKQRRLSVSKSSGTLPTPSVKPDSDGKERSYSESNHRKVTLL